EISSSSITYAKHNAKLNGIEDVDFVLGKAEEIFSSIDFPSADSVLIIDPPRKGCDSLFLDQVTTFKPETIVYVSCNVHTQARDVGYLLEKGQQKGYDLRIESLRGMDFFPQTHHIEGLCILRRFHKDKENLVEVTMET
ncbi:S-adenosyl-L-methionine-dependent methyltransferase, partial [Atractiella rhizophila]